MALDIRRNHNPLVFSSFIASKNSNKKKDKTFKLKIQDGKINHYLVAIIYINSRKKSGIDLSEETTTKDRDSRFIRMRSA